MLADIRQNSEKAFFNLLKLIKKEKGAYVNQTFYTVGVILMSNMFMEQRYTTIEIRLYKCLL